MRTKMEGLPNGDGHSTRKDSPFHKMTGQILLFALAVSAPFCMLLPSVSNVHSFDPHTLWPQNSIKKIRALLGVLTRDQFTLGK